MIASVIAKLVGEKDVRDQAVSDIASHPAMESGQLTEDRLLPVTIDTASEGEMQTVTRWLQSLDGVGFVDVVYVHFENADQPSGNPPGTDIETS